MFQLRAVSAYMTILTKRLLVRAAWLCRMKLWLDVSIIQRTELTTQSQTFKLFMLFLPCSQCQQPAHVQLRSAAYDHADPGSSYTVWQHSLQVAQEDADGA
jgi:hypothetical protein